MIADLHAHYPMHVIPPAERSVLKQITTTRGRAVLLDRIRAGLVRIASLFANYETPDGPAVTATKLHDGGVGVALSVLYSPFDEMDLGLRYGSPPLDRYPHTILRQLTEVETEVATHAKIAAIAHNPAELDAILASDRTALVHCMEGGFHLGSKPEVISRSVTELAGRGVAYITLAHLFYRDIASNAPAIPFLPDAIYRRIFPQPHDDGLTDLGAAAIEAMVREHVLIDISHMNAAAIDETFELLDRLDPERKVPVIASHVGYRFGTQEYNLDDQTVHRIAERDGVIGLILSEHQANAKDAPHHRKTKTLADSLGVVFAHLDRFAKLASTRNLAIGSDHDGFIKPALAKLADSTQLADLERALIGHYGAADAEAIASGNVLRLLRSYWRGGPNT